MRFISKQSRKYDVYWECIYKRNIGFTTNTFLWFPITIDGETRWL